MPKFTKKEEELETHFDKWMYVFTHLSQLQDRPKKLQDRVFTKLFEAAEIAKFTTKEREAYEDSLKYYRDIKNVVDTSREEGFNDGIEKGMEKGIEKGIEKGMEKGIEKRNIEIAKELKNNGVSIEIIMQSTGLLKEEIEKL